jgi:hypothetical protein
VTHEAEEVQMARRARDRRKAIPGYDGFRPKQDDRRRSHRQARHAANQMLHTLADPDELAGLPEVRSDRHREPEPVNSEVERRRFKVWKTKFWKRRDGYRQMRAKLDARWDDVTSEPEEAW